MSPRGLKSNGMWMARRKPVWGFFLGSPSRNYWKQRRVWLFAQTKDQKHENSVSQSVGRWVAVLLKNIESFSGKSQRISLKNPQGMNIRGRGMPSSASSLPLVSTRELVYLAETGWGISYQKRGCIELHEGKHRFMIRANFVSVETGCKFNE